jgi:hypothetical protein
VSGDILRGASSTESTRIALSHRGDELERGLDAGRGMTLKEVVTYALEEESADHRALSDI